MMTVFHETLTYCFNCALEGMGTTVRDVVYDFLEKKGVARAEISNMFDDVVKILTETFGASARIIIYKTVVEMHKEYSQRTDFTYQDSLKDRLNMLRDRVAVDHLFPKRSQRMDTFLEKPAPTAVVQGPGASAVRTR